MISDMEGYYPDEYGLSDHQDYRQDRSNYPYRTQAPTMAPATREGTSEQTKPGINVGDPAVCTRVGG